MNTKNLLKASGLLSLSVLALVALQHNPAGEAVASCQQHLQVAANGTEVMQLSCDTTPKQSWLAWFQGHSRSTQFHFIDLLELLNQLHSKNGAQ